MKNILVIVTRVNGALDEAAWEMLSLARSLAGDGGRVAAALLGKDIAAVASELAGGFDAVFTFDDERLAEPDAEAEALALAPLIAREGFDLTLLAHNNLGIDLAPGLSVRVGVPLLPDCFELAWQGDGLEAKRAVYGGKVHARVRSATSASGYMATIRGGAFAEAERGSVGGEIKAETLPADFAPRRRALRTVQPEAGDVDITQAELLVAVGRGIEDEDNLEMIHDLAKALGAEVCASRPVVDKGWLPQGRQVGTSGVTVKPKLYIAIGISGSFQHMGGIKGSPYLVAINKDKAAPIFGVANVGIVGDLCEVVPALEAAINEAKG